MIAKYNYPSLFLYLTRESHSFRVLTLMKETSPFAPVITPSCSQRTMRSMSSPSFHLRYLIISQGWSLFWIQHTLLVMSLIMNIFFILLRFCSNSTQIWFDWLKHNVYTRAGNRMETPVLIRFSIIQLIQWFNFHWPHHKKKLTITISFIYFCYWLMNEPPKF